jgi:hypothetical protein
MMDLKELSTASTALEHQEDGAVLVALEHPLPLLPDADVGHAAVAKGPAANVQEQMLAHLHPGQPSTVLASMLLIIIPVLLLLKRYPTSFVYQIANDIENEKRKR